MVGVPNVDGQQVSQAEQALSQAGFQVKVVQVGPFNKVFSYSPTGQAPQGSTITIYGVGALSRPGGISPVKPAAALCQRSPGSPAFAGEIARACVH